MENYLNKSNLIIVKIELALITLFHFEILNNTL